MKRRNFLKLVGVSTAVAAMPIKALAALKEPELDTHLTYNRNPHAVTKEHISLGNANGVYDTEREDMFFRLWHTTEIVDISQVPSYTRL